MQKKKDFDRGRSGTLKIIFLLYIYNIYIIIVVVAVVGGVDTVENSNNSRWDKEYRLLIKLWISLHGFHNLHKRE